MPGGTGLGGGPARAARLAGGRRALHQSTEGENDPRNDFAGHTSTQTPRSRRSPHPDESEPPANRPAAGSVAAEQTLVAALGCTPKLTGALCSGRSELFDEAAPGEAHDDVQYRHTHARALCAQCPALRGCSAWFEQLPADHRPRGVTAGRLHQPTPGRPRNHTTPNREDTSTT